jgi:hypothetical protein
MVAAPGLREGRVLPTAYLKPRGYKPLRPGQLSYWQKCPKFFVSFLTSMYGKEAASDNDFRYIDPLATETASFWENHGQYNDVDPTEIQTEVFRLPTTCFAEEDGSLTNSGRWLQWRWKRRRRTRGELQPHFDHVRSVPAFAGHVPQRGRRIPRSDPRPALA